MSTVVWFRQDLRIADNPALRHAAALGEVIPVYILDDITPPKKWRLGGASRWWLHHSLAALRKSLGGLLVMRGDPHVVLREIVDKTGANGVVWNRCYEPYAIARDAALKEQLHADGFETASFNASMLHEPWEVTTQGGAPYKVFTPYWRASRGKPVSEPLDAGALNVKIPRGLGVKLDEMAEAMDAGRGGRGAAAH
jgi:deoxyribodipyrimidine photo-lyase